LQSVEESGGTTTHLGAAVRDTKYNSYLIGVPLAIKTNYFYYLLAVKFKCTPLLLLLG